MKYSLILKYCLSFVFFFISVPLAHATFTNGDFAIENSCSTLGASACIDITHHNTYLVIFFGASTNADSSTINPYCGGTAPDYCYGTNKSTGAGGYIGTVHFIDRATTYTGSDLATALTGATGYCSIEFVMGLGWDTSTFTDDCTPEVDPPATTTPQATTTAEQTDVVFGLGVIIFILAAYLGAFLLTINRTRRYLNMRIGKQ